MRQLFILGHNFMNIACLNDGVSAGIKDGLEDIPCTFNGEWVADGERNLGALNLLFSKNIKFFNLGYVIDKA